MRRNCLNRTHGSGRKVKGYILLGSKVPFRIISGCCMDCALSMTHAAATAVEGCGVACRGQRGHRCFGKQGRSEEQTTAIWCV